MIDQNPEVIYIHAAVIDQNPEVIYIHAAAIVTLRNIYIFDVFSLIVNGAHSAGVINDIVEVIYTCATVIDETSTAIRF